jgi:hypothetical protein
MTTVASGRAGVTVGMGDRHEPSRGALVGYWGGTLFVALTALGSGVVDVLHVQPLYFATVLGVWKMLGAVALLGPRWPLVKEWAYAGMFIDYSSAVVSHLASGDGPGAIVGPVVATIALAASWYLRPATRRLPRGR